MQNNNKTDHRASLTIIPLSICQYIVQAFKKVKILLEISGRSPEILRVKNRPALKSLHCSDIYTGHGSLSTDGFLLRIQKHQNLETFRNTHTGLNDDTTSTVTLPNLPILTYAELKQNHLLLLQAKDVEALY